MPKYKRREEIPERAPHPAAVAGRVPPHHLDAEAAVLSAAMLSADVIPDLMDMLKPETFYSDANGRIWEAICDLFTKKMRVDLVTVSTWLRDHDRLVQVGNVSYVAQLADATPAVAHAMTHARFVLEAWRLRSAIAWCQISANEGYSAGADVQGYLDKHAEKIHAIATTSGGDPMRPLGDGLLAQVEGDWRRIQNGGDLMGIRTGLEKLDHLISGLHPGNSYVIAARPGMGKTSLACNIAINIAGPPAQTEALFRPAVEYGVPFFSLEMPLDQIRKRLVCTEAKVDLRSYLRGQLEIDEWERVFTAANYLSTLPIWIDDTAKIPMAQIRAKVRGIVSSWCRPAVVVNGAITVPERRLGAIIVDYLQLVGTPGMRSKEEEVGSVSADLKALAKDLKVPVIALAQLNRGVESRAAKDKRPGLADLRDSGAIEQDADLVCFVYREEYYNPQNETARGIAELIIAKQRNGPPGKILVRFDAKSTSFENLEHGRASAYSAGGSDAD